MGDGSAALAAIGTAPAPAGPGAPGGSAIARSGGLGEPRPRGALTAQLAAIAVVRLARDPSAHGALFGAGVAAPLVRLLLPGGDSRCFAAATEALAALAAGSGEPASTGAAGAATAGAGVAGAAAGGGGLRAGSCSLTLLQSLGSSLQRAEQRSDAQAQHAAKRARVLERLAGSVGPPSALHDVEIVCEDGVTLGASRLLLAHASVHYRALFESTASEGGARRLRLDGASGFSSDAHGALLRQLHSAGELELPAEHATVLELLALCAHLGARAQGGAAAAGGGGDGGEEDAQGAEGGRWGEQGDGEGDVVSRVASRCEALLLRELDVSNCVDVLMRQHALGAFGALVDAAQQLAIEHMAEVIQLPQWATFEEHFPKDVIALFRAKHLPRGAALVPRGARASLSPLPQHSAERPLGHGGFSRKRARESGGGQPGMPY